MRGYYFRTRGVLGLCLLVLGLGMLATDVHAGSNPKVTICHRPPDNPTKAKEITVGASAVPEHLAHGDFQGPCSQDCRRTPSVCNDNNACTTDTCNATTGTCGRTSVSCNDGNACTTDSCDTINGCQTAPVICDDGSQCTTEACDPATGCAQDTVSCDDNNACTSDSCTAAEGCLHESVSCDDGSQCTTDTCNPATGCAQDTVSCDDNNRCTVDSCTDENGCSSEPVQCNSGQVCNPATGGCEDIVLCGVRGGAPSAPGGTGQYTFGSFPTRAACQAACDANAICQCIVYADVSTICSLHTKKCSEIRTPGTALLYYDKFCPF